MNVGLVDVLCCAQPARESIIKWLGGYPQLAWALRGTCRALRELIPKPEFASFATCVDLLYLAAMVGDYHQFRSLLMDRGVLATYTKYEARMVLYKCLHFSKCKRVSRLIRKEAPCIEREGLEKGFMTRPVMKTDVAVHSRELMEPTGLVSDAGGVVEVDAVGCTVSYWSPFYRLVLRYDASDVMPLLCESSSRSADCRCQVCTQFREIIKSGVVGRIATNKCLL